MTTPTFLTDYGYAPSLAYRSSSRVAAAPSKASASSAPPSYVSLPRSAPTYSYAALATVAAANVAPPPPYQPSAHKAAQASPEKRPTSPWRETTPDSIAWNAPDLPGRKAWARWRARRSGAKQ